MKNLGITFVNACSGGLVFTINSTDGEIKRRADSIADGVYWVERYGLSDNGTYFSSDMDFASEEGFHDDSGAKDMFNRIMNNIDTRTLEAV
jgi:hypothetical protein